MKLKLVYVAGKFTGANAWEIAQNIRHAEHVGFGVAQAGAMPVIPHANTAHFHGTKDVEFWYWGTLEMLRRCDAMILVPGYAGSKGVAAEIEEALRLKLPIFERVEELKTWLVTSIYKKESI